MMVTSMTTYMMVTTMTTVKVSVEIKDGWRKDAERIGNVEKQL